MFKEDIQRTIGSVLKANGHKMVNLGGGKIYYIKRYSDKLGFYVRISGANEYMGRLYVDWFFTVIDSVCDSIENLSIGLHIPMLSMVFHQEVVRKDWPVTHATPETADDIMIDMGKKIVALENSMGPATEQMILEDLKNPYLCTDRDRVYKEELQVYDVLNEDEELKEAFTQFKIKFNKARKKWSEAYKLFSEFMESLPENYFESKGISFENNTYCNSYESLENSLVNYLDAQCAFGLKINGKVLGSQKDEDTQKLTKAKQQEIKEAIKVILDDFDIKTKADFMSNDGDSGLYEDLKAGVMEEYGIDDEVMGKLLDAVIRKLPKK